jgi:hypothetical protein
MTNPVIEHKKITRTLALRLNVNDIYFWLNNNGYYPESQIIPPCFQVCESPKKPKQYFKITKSKRGTNFKPKISELLKIHFPKTELTDRVFGVIDPEIHNDISFHISRNWKQLVKAIFHKDNNVISYSFPIPIDKKMPGRVGSLRAGRMIYEYIEMVDKDITAIAYQYSHIVKTDIKNFYPSIYTHSISWAIHGKEYIRKPANKFNHELVGNVLDKLFQNANDGCTNGIPVGPVVSELISEIIASGVDRKFSKLAESKGLRCQAVRYRDDYRILVNSESDGKLAIKLLQDSLKEFNLELSDNKTSVQYLPAGLFREWVSKYYMISPVKKDLYSWVEFREIYLSVLKIDKECAPTGVIDRFLSDITNSEGMIKVSLSEGNIQKILSMLLMMGRQRIRSFPKVIAIIESILKNPFGLSHQKEILSYLESFLKKLSQDEERNKYLISWICYFIVSNRLKTKISFKPSYNDPITKSTFNNRTTIFKGCKDHKLFMGSVSAGDKKTMTQYLDVFDSSEEN